MKKVLGPFSVETSQSPPPHYERKPEYDKMKQDRDVMVPMRDGVHVCVDIYRPDARGKFSALLAFGGLNKDLQTPEACETSGPQPAWSSLWLGQQEAGDTRYLVSRGYAHVIGNPRGVGKSEDGGSPQWDVYDLIEWIAQQPWCDGNIGMIGISAFASTQFEAAMQQPPHLKAIFPWDPPGAYRFRGSIPGGVLHVYSYLMGLSGVTHEVRGRPGPLPPELERRWEEAMNTGCTARYITCLLRRDRYKQGSLTLS